MTQVRSSFRQDIQRLRGVAVLLVVLFHVGVLPGGFIGVDAFFVISGYVVTASVLREIRSVSRFDLRRFLIRRARRLLPALGLMTSSVLVLSAFLLGFSVQPLAAATAAGAHLLAANAVLYVGGGGYFAPADERNPFLHTWSLSVEEQFFLILGATLFLLFRRQGLDGTSRTRIRTIVAIGAAVASISLLLSVLMSYGVVEPNRFIGLPERFAFYAPVTRLWEFAVGSLLAFRPRRKMIGRWGGILVLITPLLLLGTSLLLDAGVPFPGVAAMAPVAATALGIWAGGSAEHRGPVSREVGRPIRGLLGWLGDNSYSWYLWHWPLLVLAREVWGEGPAIESAAVLVALLVAHGSRVLIEDPIRFNRSPAFAKVLVASTLPPLIASSVVFLGGSAAWGLVHPAAEARGSSAAMKCVDTPENVWPAERCRFSGGGAGLVLLLGDSHAASLSEGVIAAAAAFDLDAAVWSKSSCPFLPGHVPLDGRDRPRADADCGDWQDEALGLIVQLEPDIVVLGHRSNGWASMVDNVGEPNERFLPGTDARAAASDLEAIENYRLALVDALTAVRGMDAGVVIVHNVPEFDRDQFDPFDRSFARSPEPPEVERGAAATRSAAARSVEIALAQERARVEVVDPFPFLCDPNVCRAAAGSDWLYFDRHHLSPSGSLRLVPGLEEAFSEVLGRSAARIP